ncbi:precorrin-8X methylmutase [Oscillatoria sp. CS-180]|uniref:precorrin-8X methylmutase n=1 Tax=Oscillatoria sp. CS-180 TaxID=3021720 RepID=UPI00232BC3DA|nr:precorrin-8X methylmutase [Oscillatoria sp. CS-180]MDB9526580.1 precorrin-8X methylmutase [Oscillatoria sp. CS-180]
MEWHISDAQSLRVIDRQIGDHLFTPSEYELVRRVIYATADFEFASLVHFSEHALTSGAAALAARTTIIVDVPMVQVGIAPPIQKTFANPVYCSMDALTRPQKDKSQTAWGIETLAQRYPEGIFIVGESQTALEALIDLIEAGQIRPALVVATPAGFLDIDVLKHRLQDSMIPNIRIEGQKGNPVLAVSIMNGLIDLAWQAYGNAPKAM